MLGELLLTIGVGLIGYAFYILLTNSAKYFEERNLKYVGLLPILKDIIATSFGRTDFLALVEKMYNVIPDVP